MKKSFSCPKESLLYAFFLITWVYQILSNVPGINGIDILYQFKYILYTLCWYHYFWHYTRTTYPKLGYYICFAPSLCIPQNAHCLVYLLGYHYCQIRNINIDLRSPCTDNLLSSECLTQSQMDTFVYHMSLSFVNFGLILDSFQVLKVTI